MTDTTPFRTVPTIARPVAITARVPGSKSIANRMLVCAALARGTTELDHVPDGDDTVAMVAVLRSLGVEVVHDGDTVAVTGPETRWPAGATTVHAALAGTTSRFVTALAALGAEPVVVDGHAPLRARPFGPLHVALTELGAQVEPLEGAAAGNLPARVVGPPTGAAVAVPGDISSQFVSALMMIGPALPDGLDVILTTELVSRPYVELTAAVMAMFGAEGVAVSSHRIIVAPGEYTPITASVEPDASSASYPLALAAVHGGEASVAGLGDGSLQGDAQFADLLAQMGCDVTVTTDATTVRGPVRSGIEVDMRDISDLVPTVAVVAAFAETPTRISGVGFIRSKESDRLGDLSAELRRAGVDIDETDDGLLVRPSRHRLQAAHLATHHDHRLAMAFAVLGTAVPGTVVETPDVVTKSWPGFWAELDRWCSP